MTDELNINPECLIDISVETRYLPEQLPEESNKYAFAYQITIKNNNPFPVKLESRYWLVTDANNKQLEVQGDGVVGKQPTIKENDSYRYSSGTVIDTPVGNMQGYYVMKTLNNQSFKAQIAPFRLALPNVIN